MVYRDNLRRSACRRSGFSTDYLIEIGAMSRLGEKMRGEDEGRR